MAESESTTDVYNEASSAAESGQTAMIEAVGLSKFYGQFAATRDVSFSVPRGQVCAFLGPNGAGKSTTMKMLTGFLAPSEGTSRIGGYDVGTQRLEAAEILYRNLKFGKIIKQLRGL